jgi:glycosyltransferase involved in cell wall biosynthesis
VPLVSVCIPTYNYARFLPQAIESVLGQTHRDLELIVLDDASTDDTAAVVEPYAGDERFRYERHASNIGLFANFNRCLEAAGGEFVKVLCADDWLHPRSLEDALAALAADPRTGLATSPGWHVDADGESIGMVRAPFGSVRRTVPGREAIAAHADWGNVAGMPSHVLLRREAIAEVGGFEPEFAPASDVHLWLKVLARWDLAWIPEPRCSLRLHGEHGHDYAYEASESVFRLWEDMARREPDAVDAAMLRRAAQREAQHHLLYVAAHAIRGDLGSARRLLAEVRRHARLPAALAAFALSIPRTAYEQAPRVFAQRTGRLVLYDPAPRAGPRSKVSRTTSPGGPTRSRPNTP